MPKISKKKMNCFETLKCKMCEFESHGSLTSHIRHKHKLKKGEYQKMFPGSRLQQKLTEEQKQARSKQTKEWFSKPENYDRYKKYHKSVFDWKFHVERDNLTEEEAKKVVSELQKKNHLNTPTETKQKLKKEQSKRNSGDRNPMSLKSISERNNIPIEEAYKFTPCYDRTGEKHPMYGKNHTDEAKEKISKNSFKITRKISKGEQKLYSLICNEFLDLDFEANYPISTYNCDCVCEELKIIIEYFGDFWHMNPSKFGKNHINERTKEKAEDRWTKDDKKIEALQNLGYDVLIVWGSELDKNKEKVLEKIRYVINNKREKTKKN